MGLSVVPVKLQDNIQIAELLIDCWCSLQEVDSREEQQVILIYTSPNKPSAEDYICKLRHSAHHFLDEVNSVRNKSTIYSK